MRSAPPAFIAARERNELVLGEPALRPVAGRNAHRERLVRGPGRAHRRQHFEREAQPVGERAAVLVRRAGWSAAKESSRAGSRAPCAARACRTRLRCRVRAERTNSSRTRSMSARVIAHRDLAHAFEIRQRRGRADRPVAGRERTIHLLPAELGRSLASRVTELQAELRGRVAVHEIDDAPPGIALRRRSRVPCSRA